MAEEKQVFISDKGLSERYGVHRGTIWRWAKDRQLPRPVKVNGITRWMMADILQWEKKQGVSHGNQEVQ